MRAFYRLLRDEPNPLDAEALRGQAMLADHGVISIARPAVIMSSTSGCWPP